MTFRKIISGALAAAMLTGMVVAGGSAAETSVENLPFTDLANNGWYESYVKYVYDNDIMKGTAPTLFEPDAPLTRAMFVTILGRASGNKIDEAASKKFKDVESDSWYSGYVGWAVENGVVEGTSADTFEPDTPIKRADIATMLGRYIDAAGLPTKDKNDVPEGFDDIKTIQDKFVYAEEYIDILRYAGIMDGKPSGGANPNFEPESSATRAEAAKLISKLDDMKSDIWEGYVPNPTDDGFALYGATYLYQGGTLVQGGLASDRVRDGGYPILTTYPDSFIASCTRDDSNTIGLSAQVAGIDPTEYKYVKVCFAYENGSDDILTGSYVVNVPASTGYRNGIYANVKFELTDGEDEDGYRTATVDLSSIIAEVAENNPTINYENDQTHILLTPDENNGNLNIRYIALFKDKESAENYVPSAEHTDYLKNYGKYVETDYSKMTDADAEAFEKEIQQRISEVMNAKSIITPESIEAAGHNCYYVSSENGDDSNDGRSPETAWKTIRHLTEISDNPFNGKVEPGDGVFFERGSVFYPERPTIDGELRGLMTLYAYAGVNYGAYGDESLPKPLFSGALDFSDTPTGNGIWEKTEYPNIWKLNQENDNMETRRNDIGNIIFNDGEFIGVHLKTDLSKEEDREKISPFGEGKEIEYLGCQSNGLEMFLSGGIKNPENIGDVLKHNLEFFQDQYEGVLYLYWDGRDNPGQNPADSFDSINASRKCYVTLGHEATSFDNIAFKYSANWLAASSILGSQFTNCEFGFCGGGYDSIASGVEVSCESELDYEQYEEDRDDYYQAPNKTHHLIENCYFHDIEDGPMSAQNGNSTGRPDIDIMRGIEYSNNVIYACGNGAELFAGSDINLDAEGYMRDRMENLYIHDNMMAYIGYGITQQDDGDTTLALPSGDILCGSIYGEMTPGTCVFENNTIYHARAYFTSAYVALEGQPRGWNLKGNTYVMPNVSWLKTGYEDYLTMNHKRNKRARNHTPYNERYIKYFNSVGFDPEGRFLWYTDAGVGEGKYVYFTTGYYAVNGGIPELYGK